MMRLTCIFLRALPLEYVVASAFVGADREHLSRAIRDSLLESREYDCYSYSLERTLWLLAIAVYTVTRAAFVVIVRALRGAGKKCLRVMHEGIKHVPAGDE